MKDIVFYILDKEEIMEFDDDADDIDIDLAFNEWLTELGYGWYKKQ